MIDAPTIGAATPTEEQAQHHATARRAWPELPVPKTRKPHDPRVPVRERISVTTRLGPQ